MTELSKATITIDGEDISIGVPFTKVNIKERTVEGFATLDNIDKVGDILDNDASLEAFKEWPGNIREMHQKIAVGKALQVSPRQYTDPDSGEVFDGIWVKARISKGAESTWEKIIDGTLTGFSVGGSVLETRPELSKASGKSVRRVLKYRLNELSTVDNPCNGLAEFALVKSMQGTEVLDDGEFEYEPLFKAKYDEAAREAASKRGDTLEDKSFPIQDQEDLDNAANDLGRTNHSKDQVLAHMRKQAKKYGLKLPPVAQDDSEDKTMEKAAKSASMADQTVGAHNPNECNMNGSDHLAEAGKHVDAYASHAAAMKNPHGAADAHRMVANLADLHNQSRYHEAMAATEGSVNKGEGTEMTQDLQNNNESGNSVLEGITSETMEKFQQFLNTFNSEQEKKELNQGDDTNEMTEETLTKALSEMTDNITKLLSDKVDGVGTELEDIKKRFDAVATVDAFEELKKSLDEVTGRVSSLESTGAIKKSVEADGTGEKLEKRAPEGIWADAIVPSILKERFSGK